MIIASSFVALLLNAQPLADNVLGLICGYALVYFLRLFYLHFRQIEAIGLGDAKLLAAIGAWLGFSNLPYVIMFAASLGMIGALIIRATRSTRIPFGPFLVISSISLFYYLRLT
jgi:Type IV leader peptidase family.